MSGKSLSGMFGLGFESSMLECGFDKYSWICCKKFLKYMLLFFWCIGGLTGVRGSTLGFANVISKMGM